jgi:hypothetical protein
MCAPNPDAASEYNMATRWRSNSDIPQNVRDSRDRSQGYLHEDGEDNLYRRGNGYRISETMTDPEVIEWLAGCWRPRGCTAKLRTRSSTSKRGVGPHRFRPFVSPRSHAAWLLM